MVLELAEPYDILVAMPKDGPKPTELGRLLKEWRAKNGYSQADVADMLNQKGPTQIQRWEAGLVHPRQDYQHMIADMIGCHVEDFYPLGALDPNERPQARLKRIENELTTQRQLLEELLARLGEPAPGVRGMAAAAESERRKSGPDERKRTRRASQN